MTESKAVTRRRLLQAKIIELFPQRVIDGKTFLCPVCVYYLSTAPNQGFTDCQWGLIPVTVHGEPCPYYHSSP